MLYLYSIFIITIIQLSSYLVYGGFINKLERERYMDLSDTDYHLNQFSDKILSLDTKYHTFIAHCAIPIFAKYYIDGVGMVPRWSKLHKQINKYYLISKKAV